MNKKLNRISSVAWFILTPHINRNILLSFRRQTNFKMPVTTRSASAEAQTKMRLRSGKVLCGVAEDQKKKKSNINKLSVVEEAKNQVRQQVKARQREIAERHIQKSVSKAIDVIKSYVAAFNETDHYRGCDPFMEKIRLIGMMYAYANSLSIHTMMHDRLKGIRLSMLNQCVSFSRDAKAGIETRIKTALKTMPDRNPEQYYTRQLDDMQGQLDKFTKTYAHRI